MLTTVDTQCYYDFTSFEYYWSCNIPNRDITISFPRENSFVKVVGQLREYEGRKHILIYDITPIVDWNELSHHLLQIIFIHLQNTRGPIPVSNWFLIHNFFRYSSSFVINCSLLFIIDCALLIIHFNKNVAQNWKQCTCLTCTRTFIHLISNTKSSFIVLIKTIL